MNEREPMSHGNQTRPPAAPRSNDGGTLEDKEVKQDRNLGAPAPSNDGGTVDVSETKPGRRLGRGD